MPEELGTCDVMQQVNARLNALDQNTSSLRDEMNIRFDRVYQEIGGHRAEMNTRFDRVQQDMTLLGDTLRAEATVNSRWQIGFSLIIWLDGSTLTGRRVAHRSGP